jgi:polyphenol oxidase
MAQIYSDTRRSFLQHIATFSAAVGAAGLGAIPSFATEPTSCAGPKTPTPVKWTPDKNPILPRLAARSLSTADVTKLRSAYTALRNLAITDPNDPRGWLQQGDKHCWQCGGGLDGQAGEEIHGSWLFFPWHRAFLYFHERILGKLINDQSLRLAYWDWNDVAGRTIPASFVTPNSLASNSLFDPNRSAVAGNSAPVSIVGPSVMNPILNAPTFSVIGGTAASAGNLENGPHGAVHIWCGDTTLNSANADMGLLDTAAQDPIFFAHHANIDRLWDVWMNNSATHKNPTAAAWLNHRFTFWDENKRWVSITIADVINMSANLRYTYGAPPAQIALGPVKLTKLTMEASTLAISLPKGTLPQNASKPSYRALRVEGITLPEGASGIYRIVANKPQATAAEVAGTDNDLGYIAIVPKTSKSQGGHTHGSMNMDFDVTNSLPGLLQANGKMSLSLAPMSGSAKGTQLTYKNVSLVEQ